MLHDIYQSYQTNHPASYCPISSDYLLFPVCIDACLTCIHGCSIFIHVSSITAIVAIV